MIPDHLNEIEEISRASLELDPEERNSYIEDACKGNGELRAAVDSRVDQYRRARQYFAGLAERLGFEGLGDARFQILEGQKFGKYKIEYEVGQGGMGIVYKAQDTEMNRPVALKFLQPRFAEDERARLRFAREAMIMESLQHQNLPVIYEVLEYKGLAVIVMEFISGITLKELLKEGALPTDLLIDYAIQIARGLEVVHETGVMHRDLKPANIMITNEGVLKILDFGLAKLHEASTVTRSGATIGTVAYMSPEQARGDRVDFRTDIWSFGVILYEMMTGLLPFKGSNDQSTMYSILNHAPDFSRSSTTDTPQYVQRIIRKALLKAPDQRFQRAQDIHDTFLHPQKALTLALQKEISLKWAVYALVGIGVILAALLWPGRPRSSSPPLLVNAVAILPFESNSAELEPVAGGVSAVLADQLGVLDSLTIVAPASTMRILTLSDSTFNAGETLGVAGYLKGQLNSQNDSLYLLVDLVNAKTDAVMRRFSIAEHGENLAALHNEAVFVIGEALGVPSSLLDETLSVPDVMNSAYQTYLKGRYYYTVSELPIRGAYRNLLKSDSAMAQAIIQDSLFADAYGWRANLHVTFSFYEGNVRPSLTRLVDQALRLDPENRYGLRASAYKALFSDWDWETAEEAFQKLLVTYPQDALLHNNVAGFYLSSNRDSLGFAHAHKAADLNPFATGPSMRKMMLLMRVEDYDEIFSLSKEQIKIDSTDALPHAYIGKAAYLSGRDSLALAHFDLFTEMAGGPGVLMAVNYLNMGRKDVFDEMHNKLLARQYPERLHYLYLALRDTVQTMHWLEKDLERYPLHYMLLLARDYEKLLKDVPRFRELLREANMEPFVYRREMVSSGVF